MRWKSVSESGEIFHSEISAHVQSNRATKILATPTWHWSVTITDNATVVGDAPTYYEAKLAAEEVIVKFLREAGET